MSLFRRKTVASVQSEVGSDQSLKRALGPLNLTALGIGGIIGAGIFVLTGQAAAKFAGPAIVFSFILAGIACAFAGLCYAEFSAMIPVSGSAYTYGYATLGELIAWFIGWDLLLEYLFAASTVAVGWAGYFTSFVGSLGVQIPNALVSPPFGDDSGVINLPAIGIVAASTALLFIGMRQSARANNAMVSLKMAVLVLFVIVGAAYVAPDNWEPFVPKNTGGFGDFGITGVIRGAGVVFFAYVGFDAVSTAAAEARDPQKTIP